MKRAPERRNTAESGNVLVIALLVLFAMSVIGATLAMVASIDLKISNKRRTTTQSLFVAEAGLNEAIHRLSLPDPTNATIGRWTGNIAIADGAPYDPEWKARIYLTSPGSAPCADGPAVSTGTLQDPTDGYMEYSRSSGSEGILTIEHKWIDRNGNGTRDSGEIVRYDPRLSPPENFESGSPVEIVRVTGHSAGGESMIIAEVAKRCVLLGASGALCAGGPVRLSGDCIVCGHDHDPGSGPAAMRGSCAGAHLGGEGLAGVATCQPIVDIRGNAGVAGSPDPVRADPDVRVAALSDLLNLTAAEAERMLGRADNNRIVGGRIDGITHISGDMRIFGDLSGEGLLYISGDMYISGGFEYRGLVYVEGDARITGSSSIVGCLVVRGAAEIECGGEKAEILYSSTAVRRALSRHMPCMVLSWREM
jgi:hypothetical protein